MINILFLHSSAELYGSDRSLLNLLRNIDKEKFKIHVILPEDGPLLKEIDKIGEIKIYIREQAVLRRKNFSLVGIAKYTYNLLTDITFILKFIKSNKIDIVYTNTSVVLGGSIAAKLSRKLSIWHVREIIKNDKENFLVSVIVNLFSDTIIANSNATAKRIARNKNIEVVYNAVRLTDKSNEKENAGTLKVGMAGRINRWKGQKLFVDMAARVLDHNENVEFLIAGDVFKGEEAILEDLKEYIVTKNIADKVTLLGNLNNMDTFYEEIDIFVLPSIQPEPFGLVVIEAMNKKLPVVATNHGGPAEIISNYKNGFLVDYTNEIDMAETVQMLLTDKELRSEIGDKAKIRTLDFSLEKYNENITWVILKTYNKKKGNFYEEI